MIIPQQYNPESVVNNAYDNANNIANAYRIAAQEKAYAYYTGDRVRLLAFLLLALKKTWSNETVDKMPLSMLNITKRIINQIAVIYKEPAQRSIYVKGKPHKQLTEYYNSILPKHVNKLDKQVHRLARLMNTVLPYITYDKEKQRFEQTTLSSDLYDVVTSDQNHLVADEISFQKYYDDNLYTVVFTDSEIYMTMRDSDEKKIVPGFNSIENPFGMKPFLTVRLIDESDFWGEPQEVLIEENEIINELLTKANYEDIILGSAGILFGTNLGKLVKNANEIDEKIDSSDAVSRKVKGGKDVIINVDSDFDGGIQPDLKYVNTNSQIDQVMNAIDRKIKFISSSMGLDSNAFSSSQTVESGFSRTVSMSSQSELRKDDLDALSQYEDNRFVLIRRMNNTLVEGVYSNTDKLKFIPEDAELLTDFVDPENALSQSDKWLDRKEREARNMGTPIQWLMEDNPDITSTKLAQSELDKNKEYLEKNPIISVGTTNTQQEEFDAKYKERNLENNEEVKKKNATT